MTLTIGPHTSIAKGYAKAARDAAAIGANTFQFFTRNPRGGNAKALDPKDIAKLRQEMAAHHFGKLLAHAPYTMNMASAKPDVRDFARRAFAEDLSRMEELPCDLYNFHPGSHTGQGAETGIAEIVEILNDTLREEMTTTVLLETMAGKGTEIGRTFEELAAIIDGVTLKDKIGVCMDTCHVYSAGYDIVGHLDEVLTSFDKIVGLDRLKAMHLNDSKTPFGSHKDRHEKLGQGSLGINAFLRIVKHPALKDLPMFLETPQSQYGDYAHEIAILVDAAES